VHTTARLQPLGPASTFEWIFRPAPKRRHWCTADVGWITAQHLTSSMALSAGRPHRDDEEAPRASTPGCVLGGVEKAQGEACFIPLPRRFRAFMEEQAAKCPITNDNGRLRILGTVGEPSTTESLDWLREVMTWPAAIK